MIIKTTERGWLVHRYLKNRSVSSEFSTPTEAQIYYNKIGDKTAWIIPVERDIYSDAPDAPGPWRKLNT